MVTTIAVATVLFSSLAPPLSAGEIEYGDLSELSGVTSIFIDTGMDLNLRNELATAIRKAAPALRIASRIDEGEIVLSVVTSEEGKEIRLPGRTYTTPGKVKLDTRGATTTGTITAPQTVQQPDFVLPYSVTRGSAILYRQVGPDTIRLLGQYEGTSGLIDFSIVTKISRYVSNTYLKANPALVAQIERQKQEEKRFLRQVQKEIWAEGRANRVASELMAMEVGANANRLPRGGSIPLPGKKAVRIFKLADDDFVLMLTKGYRVSAQPIRVKDANAGVRQLVASEKLTEEQIRRATSELKAGQPITDVTRLLGVAEDAAKHQTGEVWRYVGASGGYLLVTVRDGAIVEITRER
jgi:hypothetical protein